MKPEFTDIGKILVSYASNKREYLENLKKNYKTEMKKKFSLQNILKEEILVFWVVLKKKNTQTSFHRRNQPF